MNTFRIMTLAGWALSVLAGALGTAAAGSLDSPAAPSSSNSAMFTLEDLYQKLDNQGNAVAPRTNGFTNPAGGPTGGTFRTAADLMALVTNRAAVHKTGVTNIYKANDDGTYQIGVAWPDPRFAMESESGPGTNCVVDRLTGLTWARNGNLASNLGWGASTTGRVLWAEAFEVIGNVSSGVNAMAYGGHSDWRLPTVHELFSLYPKHFDLMIENQSDIYWSSTTYKNNTAYIWCVKNGNATGEFSKWQPVGYVLPVRGNQSY